MAAFIATASLPESPANLASSCVHFRTSAPKSVRRPPSVRERIRVALPRTRSTLLAAPYATSVPDSA
eukprot:86610-Rhodomonas_salina.1